LQFFSPTSAFDAKILNTLRRNLRIGLTSRLNSRLLNSGIKIGKWQRNFKVRADKKGLFDIEQGCSLCFACQQ
jgi:hypothetical protein